MLEDERFENIPAARESTSGSTLLEPALEARLKQDEDRLARDEVRLDHDELRLYAEEQAARFNRLVALFGIALAVILAIAVTGLVVSLMALRRDVHAIAHAAPDNSVGTAAIRESAVTAGKLAPSAVTSSALAPGAVVRAAVGSAAIGGVQLAPGAVTGAKVWRDSLTGANVREATLGRVPSANVARHARSADDATTLAGAPSSRYVSRIQTIHAVSATDAQGTKGPVRAICPAGTRVVSGGAAARGAIRGVSIVRSTPTGSRGWVAVATMDRASPTPWRLVVTAICAVGGQP
jgi:hypothetical protein